VSRRLSRVEEACKEVLSEVIQREVKDPRVGFVTITGVKLSPDLRHAKVYLSVLGSDEEVEKSLAGLKSARGYMRSELGRHLRLKYLPEIEIVHEKVTEEALRLSTLMREVACELEESGDGDDGGS
jgi:ribosome-binding factor A